MMTGLTNFASHAVLRMTADILMICAILVALALSFGCVIWGIVNKAVREWPQDEE